MKRLALAIGAILLPASFFLDSIVAEGIKAIQFDLLNNLVGFFNRFYFWIYILLLAATIASALAGNIKKDKTKGIWPMMATILTTIALTHLLKPLIHRLRPDGIPFITPFFGNVDYSFPSGHSSAAAAGAFSTPTLKVPWMIFATITVFARLYSNVHFLSDTVAGLIVAGLVAAFVKSNFKNKLTPEDKLEIPRQALHALFGLMIAWFIYVYPSLLLALPALAAFGLGFSYLLKNLKGNLKKFSVKFLGKIERKEELENFPGKGAIMLFLGSGITAAIFGKDAVAAIIILAIGDSVSHLAGRFLGKVKYGKIFSRNKTLEGSVFGFVFASAAAAFIVPIWIAIPAAGAAMVAEAFDIKVLGKKIDDNITVPVVAGAVIWALTGLV